MHNESSDDVDRLRSNPVRLSSCLSIGPISTVDSLTCSQESESGGPLLTLKEGILRTTQASNTSYSEFVSYLGESPGQTKNSRILMKPKDTCFVPLSFVELVWICSIQLISYFEHCSLYSFVFYMRYNLKM